MKPIHLTISGWGPYKNREEIDFTPLSERGIFLITGLPAPERPQFLMPSAMRSTAV